jgi:hypothetical protein
MPSVALARSPAEVQALLALKEAQRTMVVGMFGGTRLKFGVQAMVDNAKEVLLEGEDLANSVRTVVSTGKSVAKVTAAANPELIRTVCRTFIAQCAEVEDIGEIVAAIGGEAVSDLVAEVTPVLGMIYSAGKLALATKLVVEDGRNLYKHADYRTGFRSGDPLAAADAVKTIIKRDLGKHSVDLGREALSTGSKIAGACVDLGTGTNAAIGVANALAGLGLKLFQLGVDIKDLRAGNARLARPDTLDHTVFAECPILGCYLITCADTSQVVDFIAEDMGLPGWMDKVELFKRTKMDPLLHIASKAIDASSLQLDGLQANKGTYVKKGFFASLKSDMVRRVKKKLH